MLEPLAMHLYWCLSEPVFNTKHDAWQQPGCYRATSNLPPYECEEMRVRLNTDPRVPYFCEYASKEERP